MLLPRWRSIERPSSCRSVVVSFKYTSSIVSYPPQELSCLNYKKEKEIWSIGVTNCVTQEVAFLTQWLFGTLLMGMNLKCSSKAQVTGCKKSTAYRGFRVFARISMISSDFSLTSA